MREKQRLTPRFLPSRQTLSLFSSHPLCLSQSLCTSFCLPFIYFPLVSFTATKFHPPSPTSLSCRSSAPGRTHFHTFPFITRGWSSPGRANLQPLSLWSSSLSVSLSPHAGLTPAVGKTMPVRLGSRWGRQLLRNYLGNYANSELGGGKPAPSANAERATHATTPAFSGARRAKTCLIGAEREKEKERSVMFRLSLHQLPNRCWTGARGGVTLHTSSLPLCLGRGFVWHHIQTLELLKSIRSKL